MHLRLLNFFVKLSAGLKTSVTKLDNHLFTLVMRILFQGKNVEKVKLGKCCKYIVSIYRVGLAYCMGRFTCKIAYINVEWM
jgi:hypothetical protein